VLIDYPSQRQRESFRRRLLRSEAIDRSATPRRYPQLRPTAEVRPVGWRKPDFAPSATCANSLADGDPSLPQERNAPAATRESPQLVGTDRARSAPPCSLSTCDEDSFLGSAAVLSSSAELPSPCAWPVEDAGAPGTHGGSSRVSRRRRRRDSRSARAAHSRVPRE
jgi:hypothetical protein